MKKDIKRTFYIDRYNKCKVWEVAILKGGYYLRQYIKGKQLGRGIKVNKKFLTNIGILDYEVLENFM